MQANKNNYELANVTSGESNLGVDLESQAKVNNVVPVSNSIGFSLGIAGKIIAVVCICLAVGLGVGLSLSGKTSISNSSVHKTHPFLEVP